MLFPGYRPAVFDDIPITAIMTMKPEGTGTRYVFTALHRNEADLETNKTSGFYEGTEIAVDQFVAHVDVDEIARGDPRQFSGNSQDRRRGDFRAPRRCYLAPPGKAAHRGRRFWGCQQGFAAMDFRPPGRPSPC